jgi:hypothetical protein
MIIWRCFIRKSLFFLALIVCLSSIAAPAAVIDQIAEDFRSLSGYVVKSIGDEVLIDLDQSHGISAGDIFSVIAAGEAVVHPVTGKVLGALEETKAIVQVTRLKQGYSYARLLRKTAEIKAGDPIRRFENLSAVMWDYTAEGKTFSSQLQSMLPGMDWQPYESAQRLKPDKLPPPSGKTYDLMFILTENGLEVRGPDFQILHQYDLPESISVAAKVPPVAQETESPPTGMLEEKGDIRFSAVFKKARTIGNLPGLTLMSDFVKLGGQLLMATTDGSQIYVFEVTDKLDRIAKGDTPVPAQILALKWWLPAEGEPVYLTVVAWNDRKLASTIFKFKDGHLSLVKMDIPRILGTFDLDGDGRPETLLGQTFESEGFFGTNIRKLILNDGKIKNARPPISFHRRFTVLGSQIADLTGDGNLESVFIRSGILYVYSGKKQVYVSPKEMGGTISVLTYEKELLKKDIMTQTAAFEISPVATDLDRDGRLELLTVSSHKTFFTVPGITPNVKKTRLAVLKYHEGRFTKGTLGEDIDRPIQGLTVSDDRVLFLISEPSSLLGNKGRSHLLGYPLAKR